MVEYVVEERQSTSRDLLNRLHRSAATGLLSVLTAGVMVYFGLPVTLLGLAVTAPVGLSLAGFARLRVFNTGPDALPSRMIRITAEGIELHRYEDQYRVGWTDYAGAATRWLPSRQVRIHARRGRGFAFDYYAFSPEQRRRILGQLQIATLPAVASESRVPNP